MSLWNPAEVDLHTSNPGARRMRRDKRIYQEVGIGHLIVETTLRTVLSPELRRKLSRGEAGCVTVLAPGASWLGLIETVLEEINNELHTLTRSGRKKAEDDGRDVSRRLSEGQTVVGITTDASLLPAVFKTLTQETVKVPSPTHATLATVIRKVSSGGRIPATFSEIDFSSLDFDELCGLIKFGNNAAATVSRIAAAVASKTRTAREGEILPDIEQAIEFGDARLWAMDLKQDLADQKAGLIGPEAVDKGILLSGPPGVGKTLMARSLGQYLGVPVILGSISDYLASGTGYLDNVIKAQRALFERAKEAAPCVLFIDEIDAYPDLNEVGQRNKDWWVPIVNDFLMLLDGAAGDRNGVIVIGASNRDRHMASLTRPGRLERIVYMGPPNAAGAVRVLRHHLGEDLPGVDLNDVGTLCASREMTSAQIMELVRSAKRAGRRAGRSMELGDLVGRLIPPDNRPAEYRRRVALHEAGHAVVGHKLLGDRLVSVTLTPGHVEASGGATLFRMPEIPLETMDNVRDRVVVLLSGRAAEIEFLGQSSTGSGGAAQSDLGRAVQMLAAASISYGIGDTPRWRCEPNDVVQALSFDRELRSEVERDLKVLAEVALDLARENRAAVHAVANALLAQPMLTSAEVGDIVRRAEMSTDFGEAA